MDFGFEGFESADFDVELEDVEVKRIKRFERLWKIGRGGSICYTRVFDGIVYFGSADKNFYAIDAESGKELWRFRTGGVIMGWGDSAGDSIFFTSFDQYCYAVDRRTGKELWRFRANGEMFEGPVYGEGSIIIGTKGGYVHSINAKTGKEIWTFKTGDDILSGATIYEGNVYIGSCDSNYYCISLENGKEVWRFKTGDLIHSDMKSPVVDGKIFFGSFDSHLYCLDVKTGKEIWRFKTGQYGNSEPPLYRNGVLYQGSRDGILFAISLEGKELWRFKTGGLLTMPIEARGRLYFGSEDGFFRCLDLKGNELWRFNVQGLMWDVPSYANGRIIFGTWSCHVHSLDALSGEEDWRFTTSDASPSSVQPPHESFKMEIKKMAQTDMTAGESKYRGKKGETVSLSNYHIANDYSTTSEYKQKSDYDTSFVMFEGVLKTEELPWISVSKDSNQRIST
jgi:outer membrane protein assembly factor BamB